MGRESLPCNSHLGQMATRRFMRAYYCTGSPPTSYQRRRLVMDDPEAAMMRVLYDEHGAALWRYALRLTGDQARAEDVVQETLLRAWRHPEGTDDVERSARR